MNSKRFVYVSCPVNERFTIGTLSHSLGVPVRGYLSLPVWPVTQPDPSVRDVVVSTALSRKFAYKLSDCSVHDPYHRMKGGVGTES